MKWTKEKPNKEGWYWVKFNSLKSITYVCKIGNTLISTAYNYKKIPPEAEWAGPIPEPEE
jgi:hypothetical protein